MYKLTTAEELMEFLGKTKSLEEEFEEEFDKKNLKFTLRKRGLGKESDISISLYDEDNKYFCSSSVLINKRKRYGFLWLKTKSLLDEIQEKELKLVEDARASYIDNKLFKMSNGWQ